MSAAHARDKTNYHCLQGGRQQLGCSVSASQKFRHAPPRGGGAATVTPFVGTGPIVHVLTYQAKVAQTRKAARQTVPVENWKAEHLQELEDD
jgi:hypothetical protein